MSQPTISVVLPAFNEAENLVRLVPCIVQHLESAGLELFEVIVIDDGSIDHTRSVLSALANGDARVISRSLPKNQGHQQAISAGLKVSRGKATIVMDSDFQHPPKYLPEMISAWERGDNIVTMRRSNFSKGHRIRQFASWVFYRLLKLWCPTTRLDTSDFFLIDKNILEIHKKIIYSNRYHRGFIGSYPVSRCELKFTQGNRHAGKSKYSFLDVLFFAMSAVEISRRIVALDLSRLCGQEFNSAHNEKIIRT